MTSPNRGQHDVLVSISDVKVLACRTGSLPGMSTPAPQSSRPQPAPAASAAAATRVPQQQQQQLAPQLSKRSAEAIIWGWQVKHVWLQVEHSGLCLPAHMRDAEQTLQNCLSYQGF